MRLTKWKNISIIFSLLMLTIITGNAQIKNNPVIISGNARFTVITPICIRIEYAQNGNFVNERTLFADDRNALFDGFDLVKTDKEIKINTGKIILTYKPDGKPFSKDNLSALIKKDSINTEWFPNKKNEHNLGGTLTTLDNVSRAVPVKEGLLSQDGWYIIDDSNTQIFNNDWITQRSFDSKIDWYLFGYGTEYKEALKSLTTISGNVPMLRKHVLGSWYCRWYDYTADEFLQIVAEYKEHDFPIDILVMDMGWHRMDATYGHGHAIWKGWTGYSWNKKLIPDPEGLLKKLNDDHIYVTLNDHPHDGIRNHEDTYPGFMRSLGKDPSTKENLPYNAGDKAYMDAIFKYGHRPLESMGVDFWWVDWQQDYIYPFVYGYPGLKHLPWLNYLYFKNSEQNGKRGLGFSRWGGWGDHKHPIQFSGDITSKWETLRFEVSFTANSGNVGCFFWAHDLGGFYGDRNPEQFARWVQFGLTNASLRLHSAGENLDRRPWLWGKEYEESMKIIFHLRSQLFPYIYSSVRQCNTQSLPLLRPMYIEYPANPEAFQNPQEYLFGDNFLSAPIVSPGDGPNKIAKQRVWFPEGSWYNIFSNEKYEGSKTDSVSADLFEFPFYARGGVPIPMQPYSQRMASEALKNLIVRCYPGKNGIENQYDLYEDDGQSNDYKQGGYALTTLKYKLTKNKAVITILPTKGSYTGQLKTRSYQIELACTQKASKVLVNGKVSQVKYDAENYTNIILIPESSIYETRIVEVTAAEADQKLIVEKAKQKRKF